MIGTTSSGILGQLRDIYSICSGCWNKISISILMLVICFQKGRVLNVATHFDLANRIKSMCLFLGCCILYYLKTCDNNGIGTAYPSGALEFNPGF